MAERDNLLERLDKIRRRLAVLELQRAGFGPNYSPAHLILEIEDAQKEIATLEAQLLAVPAIQPTPILLSPLKAPRTSHVPRLRIFLASPGDVNEERKIAQEVLDVLQYDPLFQPGISLQTVAWDKPGSDTPMRVTMTPQTAIRQGLPLPSQCDIVLVFFWGRMGTPLAFPEYQKEDGSPYLSGTEWEFWDGLKGERATGRPVTLIYRRTEPPRINITDRKQVEQFYQVQDFFEQFRDKTSGAILAGINEYRDPEDLRMKLINHLRKIIYSLISQEQPESPPTIVTTTPITRPPLWDGSPFPGLRAFGEEDAPIFFGRGVETGELVKRVEASRFVAVMAASGSGKSSLVAAGLIPRLKANAIAGGNTGSKDWHFVYFKPGQEESPLVALFEGLCRAFPGHQVSPFLKPLEKQAFLESVKARPTAIIETIERLLAEAKAPAWSEIFFFIDQFEELFSLVAESELPPFIALLESLSRCRRCRVIVTIRSDFYDKCLEYPGLAGLLNEGSYSLALPTAGALVEMIKRPAERAGLSWDDGLPEQIQAETGNKPGALALMAYLLDELYKVAEKRGDKWLRFEDYKALGGVEGAIGQRAEQAFEKIEESEEEKTRLLGRVFRELVEVNEEGKATRRRVSTGCFNATELTMVEAFTRARLLVKDAGQVEVAHEALFRSWERLARWVEERQEDFILRRQVRNSAAEWRSKNYPAYLLWPQERLILVYTMRERLEWQPDEIEQKFIEPEQARLLREIYSITTSEVRRRDIGDRLSVIVDIRRGVGVRDDGTPEIEWLPVSPGGKINFRKKNFEVRPFYIAKYLITYAQYEGFVVAEDGFNNIEWWQDMPENYRLQELGEQFIKSWNNPRDGVSWYQSVAFTRWLNYRMYGRELAEPGNPSSKWVIGRNAEVRLPLEWEWQWAAQGGSEQRRFPWGNWEKGYANTSESGLNRAIGVGLYPQGAAKCRALDMAGNLEEWCLNKNFEPEAAMVDKSEAERVLRGGACNYYQDAATCAYRFNLKPSDVYFNCGFRVVLCAL